jgi:hypothetical protein
MCLQPQAAEPPLRKVQMHLIAEPALGADPGAVADEEHADRQLRAARGAAHLAVERTQSLPNPGQVDEPVDRAQQVVGRHVPLQAEPWKRVSCPAGRLRIISPSPPSP